MSKSAKTIMDAMRDAIRRDGRSLRELGRDAGVDAAVVMRFLKAERDITMDTADRLCKVLGLELRPIKRKGR